MYDKFGLILRIETTVNDVAFFPHYREVEQRDGTRLTKWTHLKRSLYSLPALRAARRAANRVGGIDLNQARMRHVVQAIVALSPSPKGFAASQLADKVRSLTGQAQSEYGPRRAAYDLKKLRAKQLARRIESTHRYEATPEGLRALVALWVLHDKVIKPLLAAASQPSIQPQMENPTSIDQRYRALRLDMQGLFQELGLVA